ncbi:MAG: pyridoxine 5'-phosphate synthase [Alphaproteobacteria bacterium]|nr:pyridoxine 5'-phosphate synthase [Alphaproteobacteria bacterium]
MSAHLRLGVNIDHVATVRNARGEAYPSLLRAARIADDAGANGITVHVREDRRHVTEMDLAELLAEQSLPVNLEMAPTAEMLAIALHHRPHAVCLVPEKREERTTEGGLDAYSMREMLTPLVARLREAAIRVSLFIEPDERQVDAAFQLGVPAIELHTGCYANLDTEARSVELGRLRRRCATARSTVRRLTVTPCSRSNSWRTTSQLPRCWRNRSVSHSL